MANQADYSRLTDVLRSRSQGLVTLSWQELDEIVGGLPASAVKHHPQWWHGERSHILAWRRAGYELESVELGRSVTFRRTDIPTPSRVGAQSRTRLRQFEKREPAVALMQVVPRTALVVIGCSAEKARGGDAAVSSGLVQRRWPNDLLAARAHVSAMAHLDERALLPAWRRYTGHFYRQAQGELPDAVANGRLVVLSGGYGIVSADEPIGYYDRRLRLTDWPPGLLERLLVDEARRVGARSVVGFVARTSEYARLLRRADWSGGGVNALAVTVDHGGGSALREVPRLLGRAFGAFWRQDSVDYPKGTNVEALS